MRVVVWFVRALVFFVLFAFALNNQHPVRVHWFFGFEWQAPMVIVVLAALAGGALLGVLAMLPSWWRARRGAFTAPAAPASVAPPPAPAESTSALPPAAIYDGSLPAHERR